MHFAVARLSQRGSGETVIFRSSRVINIIRWLPVSFLITSVFNVRPFNHTEKYPWNILADFIAGSPCYRFCEQTALLFFFFFVTMETTEGNTIRFDGKRGTVSRYESRSKISYCWNWTCRTVTLRESLITDCLFWRDRPSTDTTRVRAKYHDKRS